MDRHRGRGRIVLLNGASSSGKTSIAEQLLEVLPTPWFHLGVDAVNAMRSRTRTRELDPGRLEATFARTRAGHCRAVAGMAEAGNDVVADTVLWRPGWLDLWLEVMAGHDVTFVGVRCALPELERREAARGDREPGKAATQHPTVHAPGHYDVEVDTGTNDPRTCALRIRTALEAPGPRAFDRLRRGA